MAVTRENLAFYNLCCAYAGKDRRAKTCPAARTSAHALHVLFVQISITTYSSAMGLDETIFSSLKSELERLYAIGKTEVCDRSKAMSTKGKTKTFPEHDILKTVKMEVQILRRDWRPKVEFTVGTKEVKKTMHSCWTKRDLFPTNTVHLLLHMLKQTQTVKWIWNSFERTS